MDIRVGFGYDSHRLISGRRFVLGGVEIPHSMGLMGHSDADVLIHAICDAILGALSLGDIGTHFPDADEKYRDADSTELLREVMTLAKKRSFVVNNLDCTVCAELPKLNPFRDQIKEKLAALLDVESDRISVKATTNEKMGFVGREEGVAAYAIVMMKVHRGEEKHIGS